MTQEPKPLNRFEVWASDHAAPIFGILATLIVLGAGAVFYTYQRSSDAQDQVNVLRPRVTTINRAICDARSLESEDRARRCAERIRVGLVNCRRYDRCRAAFLAALTYPPPARPEGEAAAGGGDAQNPSQAGQQPGRGDDPGDQGKGAHGGDQGGSDGGGGDQGNGASPEPGSAPSPGAPPPDTGSSAAPDQGDEGTDEAPSKSGVEVEACLLVTCVEVGVGK